MAEAVQVYGRKVRASRPVQPLCSLSRLCGMLTLLL